MHSKIAALILAGGKNKEDMRVACGGIDNRALTLLNGKPMLDYVVKAVQDGLKLVSSDTPARILVAGEVPLPEGTVAVLGGKSMIDTLLSGVAALRPDETRLLVITADIPFLTPEAVAEFVRKAEGLGEGVNFVYPIIDAARCREKFPEMRRTTLRVAEGVFTGGNLSLLDPAFLRRNDGLLRAAYARRKSVVGLAQLLGADLLFRLVASRAFPGLLTIRYLESAVGRALGGANARALITDFPEIGADVDRPEDIGIAERLLGGRPESNSQVDSKMVKTL